MFFAINNHNRRGGISWTIAGPFPFFIAGIKIKCQYFTIFFSSNMSNTAVGAKWNTPVLKDGFLYGFTDQKRIYCLNAATGQTAWIDNVVNSDFSTIADCGSVIIGLASTANLIIFKPESSEYKEVVKYKVSETAVYSYPVIAGNKIYIKDAETLMMYSF